MPRLKPILQMAAYNILVVSLLFLFAEIALGAAGVRLHDSRGRTELFAPEERAVSDALDSLYLSLGARARKIKGTPLWTYRPARSAHYNINSLGFRGPEAGARTDLPETRIAVLGGSTVWGSMVADQDTIPARLEAALSAAFPGRSIRVYNLGIEGYVFQQEVALSERLIETIDPDALVFYHFFNDALSAYHGFFEVPIFQNDEDTYLAERQSHTFIGRNLREAKEWLLGNSRIVRVMQRALRWLRTAPPAHELLAERLHLLVEGHLARATALSDRARDRDTPLYLFLQPSIITKDRSTALEEGIFTDFIENNPDFDWFLLQAVDGVLERRGSLPLLDLSHLFSSAGEPLFWDCVHVTPRANQLIADAMARELGARLFSPAGGD